MSVCRHLLGTWSRETASAAVFSKSSFVELANRGCFKPMRGKTIMRDTKRILILLVIAVVAVGTTEVKAVPSVPSGYSVEAYVTGLQNVAGLAFSPGGEFGYEGELFVGDSRPLDAIYRVPSKDNKIFFANSSASQIIDMKFAPIDSPFGPRLFATHGYDIFSYDTSGTGQHFANVNAFPWDLAFAPDERFRNNLFQADGWEPAGDGEAIREWSPDGTRTLLDGNLPEEIAGLAFASGGAFGNDLYVAFASSRGSTAAIRKVTPSGIMTDFVVSPLFGQTNQLAFDTRSNFNDNLFVSDFEHDVVFEIDPSGNVTEFANSFSFSSNPDHPTASGDLAFGPDGALYVADGGAGTVWRISRSLMDIGIDIRPGNGQNPLNLKSNGVLPVAIFGEEGFDVYDIDPLSLSLDGALPQTKGNSGKVGTFRDINGDDLTDLILHFDLGELDVDGSATELILEGALNDGTAFNGSDSIRFVGPGDVNADGFVDGSDLSIVISNWGQSVPSGESGDLDGNGIVDGSDYSEVISYWGQSSLPQSPAAIPEPATLGLLLLGVLALLRRRHET